MNKDMYILFHLEFDHVIMIYMYIVDLYIQNKCTCIIEFDHVIMIYMYIVDLYIQNKCTCIIEFDHVIMIYMYIVDLYIQNKCTCIMYVSELTGLKKKQFYSSHF